MDVLRAGREERVGEHVRKQRDALKLRIAAERMSASNARSVSVARARIERSAKRRSKLTGGPCANGYAGIVSDITSCTRYEAAARFATYESTVLLLEQ